MKKFSLMTILLCVVCIIGACRLPFSPAPVPTPTEAAALPTQPPAVQVFEYRRAEYMDRLCRLYRADRELLVKLSEGARGYAGSVNALPPGTDARAVELVSLLLSYDPELFYVNSVSLSEDGEYIDISYSSEQLEAEKAVGELTSQLENLLSGAMRMNYTDFENTLAAYRYITENVTAAEGGASSCYDAVVKKSADSAGIAKSLQFLLSQAGIESYVASSTSGMSWVTAELDGMWYHFNPYLESKSSNGQDLTYFAYSDADIPPEDREYLVQDGLLKLIAGDGARFGYMRSAHGGYGVNFAEKALYYINADDNNKICKYYYQQNYTESLMNKRAQAMVYKNGRIYFADMDNRNKLCVLDLASGTQEELDSVFVTRMYEKGGKLIYFDDVSNTEYGIEIR